MGYIIEKILLSYKIFYQYQLCLGIFVSGFGYVLRPADVFCAKAQR